MKTTLTLLSFCLILSVSAQDTDASWAYFSNVEDIHLDWSKVIYTAGVSSRGEVHPIVLRGETKSHFATSTDLFEVGIILEKAGRQKNGALLTFFLTGCTYALLTWADILSPLGNAVVLSGGLIIGGILNISGNANIKKAGRALQL